ncbi:MAG TPA: hypothetical protein VHM88_15670, partial [Candidatus Acidoferrales bacterium]|nr:hypothetical protein [Candidatus Acidoferrales bacterium]
MKRTLAWLLSWSLLLAPGLAAQQGSPAISNPPPATAQSAEFLKAADEVLADMSALLGLAVKSPLKKSIRTREDIRAYIVRRMKEDKDAAKR